MIRQTAIVLALAAVGTTSAWAASPSQQRGYNNCERAVKTDTGMHRLVHARVHYVAERADDRVYYINSNGWRDGGWVALGSECVTPKNGTRVVSIETFDGHFTNRGGEVRIEVASR